MFNLDPAKLLVILVLGLIVLGPERLPKVARQVGGAWHELTKIRDQVTEEVRGAIPDLKIPKMPNTAGMISSFLFDPAQSGDATSTDASSGTASAETAADSGVTASRTWAPRPGGQVGPAPADGEVTVLSPDDPSMN